MGLGKSKPVTSNVRCKNIKNSLGCVGCSNCKNCYFCVNCENCDGCSWCVNCNGCLKTTNSFNSTDLYGCDKCIESKHLLDVRSLILIYQIGIWQM